MQLKHQEILSESLEKAKTSLEAANEKLQKQLAESMSREEHLERDLYTKSELLKTAED